MPELLAPFSLPVDTKQVIVKGTTGQTANLLELQDSSAVAKLTVTATGAVKVATTSTLGTSELLRVGAVAHPLSTAVMEIKVPTSTIGLVVEGASALSFQNSAGSVYLTCSEFLMYAPGMDCTFATGTFDTGVISSIQALDLTVSAGTSAILVGGDSIIALGSATNQDVFLRSKGTGAVRVNSVGASSGTGGFSVHSGGAVSTSVFAVTSAGNTTIAGTLQHNGSTLGVFGTTAAARSASWSVTGGYTADKAFNPESTSVTEVARVLGTLIDALKTYGLLGA